MKDNSETISVIILVILFTLIGGVVGNDLTIKYYRKQAIQHNAAYYNPTNAEFTWKTNMVDLDIVTYLIDRDFEPKIRKQLF